jgi:3-oxoacyl-(acyl-carrier-protein) synthase
MSNTSNNRRIVVTGMGWVTPLGHDVDSVWQRLLRSESGMGPTTRFDARTFPTTFTAEVKNYEIGALREGRIGARDRRAQLAVRPRRRKPGVEAIGSRRLWRR